MFQGIGRITTVKGEHLGEGFFRSRKREVLVWSRNFDKDLEIKWLLPYSYSIFVDFASLFHLSVLCPRRNFVRDIKIALYVR